MKSYKNVKILNYEIIRDLHSNPYYLEIACLTWESSRKIFRIAIEFHKMIKIVMDNDMFVTIRESPSIVGLDTIHDCELPIEKPMFEPAEDVGLSVLN